MVRFMEGNPIVQGGRVYRGGPMVLCGRVYRGNPMTQGCPNYRVVQITIEGASWNKVVQAIN